MDKRRDDVHHQIEQTRRELSDQLAELALRVDDASDRARSMVKPRYWYERKPWLVIAGSIATGYAVERSIIRGRRRREHERDGRRISIAGDPQAHRQILSKLDAMEREWTQLASLEKRVARTESRQRAPEIGRERRERSDQGEVLGDIARVVAAGLARALFARIGGEGGSGERRRGERRRTERRDRPAESRREPPPYERPWLR